MGCPKNAISYNGTHCACPTGQLLNRTTNSCVIFGARSEILTDAGVDYYTFSFPETIFSFDSIKKFTQSQAVFLEATVVMLLSWLAFCFFLRFMKLGDGRNLWFNIRWWISRLDICFATRHWLDDQRVVRKRKTELGGTFSIASWILFIGLFAALLYQIITKRTIEVHNVRATNAPDLASFVSDMEFNITTVSSMSCSNLRGIGNLVFANPGFTGYRVDSLSSFMGYSCQNTSSGPTITFKCSNCRLFHDYMYISWQFVDLPDNPAAAVGFQFNFTSKSSANKKHISFVSGTLRNGSSLDDRPVTFRGEDANILKFNLFPRIYRNLHDLKLIQPLFHEFVPGSNYGETTRLQSSLERSTDGLMNTTLFVNYLSSYIIEIDNENIMGPVSFLADLGGLYCISIGIFFYFLAQCEYRIKKLRHEDSILRKIRSRRKAQEHWDKLRKYVMYTWGCSTMNDDLEHAKKRSSCSSFMRPSVLGNGSLRGSVSSRKQILQNRMDSINFNKKVSLPSEKNATSGDILMEEVKSCEADIPNRRGSFSNLSGGPPIKSEVLDLKDDGKKLLVGSCNEYAYQHQTLSLRDDDIIPLPPPLDFSPGPEVEMSDILKNLHSLYDYNIILRQKFLALQSSLHALAAKSSPTVTESHS